MFFFPHRATGSAGLSARISRGSLGRGTARIHMQGSQRSKRGDGQQLASSDLGELQPADLTGRLVLANVSSHQQAVVNTMTGEVVRLPPGRDRQLVYDSTDANGMVFRESDMQAAMYLHDIFKEEVFQSAAIDDLFVKIRGKPGWKRWQAAVLERRGMIVCVRLRLLAAKQSLTATVFRRRRSGGFMVYWPIPVLYHLFAMTSFSGWSSKWVQHSHPRWAASFRKAFGYEAFVGSTHGNTSKAQLSNVGYTDRCLEQLSCCTSCFVWLLCRWAFASREQGGLTQPTAQASAEELLRALLDVLLDVGPDDESHILSG